MKCSPRLSRARAKDCSSLPKVLSPQPQPQRGIAVSVDMIISNTFLLPSWFVVVVVRFSLWLEVCLRQVFFFAASWPAIRSRCQKAQSENDGCITGLKLYNVLRGSFYDLNCLLTSSITINIELNHWGRETENPWRPAQHPFSTSVHTYERTSSNHVISKYLHKYF